jgi:hypothetical protein
MKCVSLLISGGFDRFVNKYLNTTFEITDAVTCCVILTYNKFVIGTKKKSAIYICSVNNEGIVKLEKRINTFASGVKKVMRIDSEKILVICESGEIFQINNLDIGPKS